MRRLAGAAAIAAAVVTAAGCGTGGIQKASEGDASQGKTLFTQKCASCHTLADAGATGTVGPNLDEAFHYDRKQGFAQSTILQIVKEQIKIAYPPMPNEDHLFPRCEGKHPVSGCSNNPHDDVASVADYVASVAGKTPAGGVTKPTTPAAATQAAQAPAGGGQANAGAQGKQIFASAGCSACHTLKDAGATGTVGPNLDQLKPPEDVVEKQVTNGGKVMPAFKGRLTPEQIKAVAAYVSSVAGK